MTCITIASWMLAVVGAITFVPSIYRIKWTIDNNAPDTLINVTLFCLSFVGFVFGGILLSMGIIPYIPTITLPCITLVP